MTVFLKYIIRCVWQDKARTSLILCAIMISSGMLFASLSISSSLVQIQMENWRSVYGYSDVVIHSNDTSPVPWFYMNEALTWMPSAEYIIGELSGYGMLETSLGEKVPSFIRGIDWDDLQQLTPFELSKDEGILPFAGGKLVIGNKTAQAYQLEVGDIVYLSANNNRHALRICGIAKPTPLFDGAGSSLTVVVPRERLASMMDIPGRVDRIFIKLKHPQLKYRLITRLSIPYKRYTVRESFSTNDVKRQTDRIATPILIVAVILSFMSITILYTAFKVIMMERLPVVGTFRSIGATVRRTRWFLLIESLTYGVVGGLFGCIFGLLLLSVMAAGLASEKILFRIPPFDWEHLVISFAAAVFLSLAGAILPAIKISSLPVKQLIFELPSQKTRKGYKFFIAGLMLLAVSLVAPVYSPPQTGRWVSTASVVLFFVSITTLIPYVARGFSYFAIWPFRLLFQNEGLLALRHIRQNKNALNNIALLAIGISGLFMVATLNAGEMRQIMNSFDRCHYDILIQFPQPGKNVKNMLKDISSVEDVLENQKGPLIRVEGREEPIYHFQGIDTQAFQAFHALQFERRGIFLQEHLGEGRRILLSTILRDRWDLKEGDILPLIFPGSHGNTSIRNYTLSGFFEPFFPGQWSYALVSEYNYKRDFSSNQIGPYYVKSRGNTIEAVMQIQSVFARQKPVVRTIADIRQEILDENRQVFAVLELFSLVTALTGAFGVLNNMIIGFMERKRTLAILRSLGMSYKKMVKMLFYEGFACGIVGGFTGVGSGLIILGNIVPYVIKAIGSEIVIHYSLLMIGVCFSAGFLIPIFASIGPVMRLRKMNLISALQYE